MPKPAARLLDMTAHGGMITGPGCPTVFIGKKPAARMTDMHVCPMLTGTVPHVGGPHIGPVPPTVLIGMLPAACAGDMSICTGPPSTVLPPGAPTVLIGSSGRVMGAGGAGGGGSGGGASAQPVARQAALVKGTEAFPVEIQRDLAQTAEYKTPAEMELLVQVISGALRQGSGADDQSSRETELTIADIVDILLAIEREESYEAARHFASHLDYTRLTEMALSGTEGNDPNQMPTRFMLLIGANDSLLETVDPHPDGTENGEEHKICVENLRRALRLLGHEVQERGPFDETVRVALTQYLAQAWGPSEVSPGTYTVQLGDTLSALADEYGIISWKYLYEINKKEIGDNPDLLPEGIELTIPSWDHTSGEEKIAAKGARPFRYVGGVRYAYPWVAYSVTLFGRNGELLRRKNSDGEWSEDWDEECEYALYDGESERELVKGQITRPDEIETLVPDAMDKVLVLDGVGYG